MSPAPQGALTDVTEYAWVLRGRVLDLSAGYLAQLAVAIRALPADTGCDDARQVRHIQRMLRRRDAARLQAWLRHQRALSRSSRYDTPATANVQEGH